MREILFRGKTEKGEWVEGFYTKGFCDPQQKQLDDMIYMFWGKSSEWFFDYAHVILETVGQYTGLTDKNGKKIFEGDIVKDCGGTIGVVKFGEGTFDSGIYRYMGFYYEEKDGTIDHNSIYDRDEDWAKFEVIGNIHDNPELLGE